MLNAKDDESMWMPPGVDEGVDASSKTISSWFQPHELSHAGEVGGAALSY